MVTVASPPAAGNESGLMALVTVTPGLLPRHLHKSHHSQGGYYPSHQGYLQGSLHHDPLLCTFVQFDFCHGRTDVTFIRMP